MAYGNTLLTPSYKLLPARTKTSVPLNTAAVMEHVYTVFAVSFAFVLICMALKMVFALFLINGPFVQAISTFTAPLIAPFSDIFHDGQSMIQISTMSAFTTYYLIYGVVSRYLAFFRHHFTA